ncbi:MAG: hypothetical protein VX834_10650 [Myxococcota bacterium]|nr:hypothetical protein [Myxococcota bacterium]
MAESPWDSYEVEPPNEELARILQTEPARYPEKKCRALASDHPLYESEHATIREDGIRELCVWNDVSGNVPEGYNFTDFASCESSWTQGPSWFFPPQRMFESDPALLEDPEFMRELDWVKSQAATSGCSCCHSSATVGYASRWDIDAPEIWTDTMPLTTLAMAAGIAETHVYFGYFEPTDNFGFDRRHTVIATTDKERMKRFFTAEYERRGGTLEFAQQTDDNFREINRQLFEPSQPCGPGEGLTADGQVVWLGDGARQVYILEEGAENPGFPPTFDLPEQTLWALYADPTAEPIESGSIRYGDIPAGTAQFMPRDGTLPPELEVGTTYRLFVTPDFVRARQANCTFTYGVDAEVPRERTCDDQDSVCVTLEIPEDLSTTPETLLLGFYKELPPMGPPDIFPPLRIDSPELEPGGTIDLILAGTTPGTFQIYAVIYMPGGGLVSWRPLEGVDYVGTTPPIELNGEPIKLDEPITFAIATEE